MQGDAGAVNGANEEQPRSSLQSVESLLVQAYEEEPAPGGQQRAPEPAGVAPEDEQDELPEADEDGEEPEEGEAGDPEPVEDPEVQRWVDALVKRPQRIEEVGGRHRATVVVGLHKRLTAEADAVRAAAAQALEVLNQRFPDAVEEAVKERLAQERKAWEEEYEDVARFDAMDETELGLALRDEPAKVQKYLAYRARTDGNETPPEQKANGSQPDIPQDVRELFDELKAQPRAMAILTENEKKQPGIYDGRTPEGIARFRRDANRALARAETESTRQPDPDEATAERRREAAQARRALPRPDTGNSRGATTRKPELSNDPRELLSEAFEEALAKTR